MPEIMLFKCGYTATRGFCYIGNFVLHGAVSTKQSTSWILDARHFHKTKMICSPTSRPSHLARLQLCDTIATDICLFGYGILQLVCTASIPGELKDKQHEQMS